MNTWPQLLLLVLTLAKFHNSCITGMAGVVDVKQKGSKLIAEPTKWHWPLTTCMALTMELTLNKRDGNWSFITMTITFWWPRSGVRSYQKVARVTLDVDIIIIIVVVVVVIVIVIVIVIIIIIIIIIIILLLLLLLLLLISLLWFIVCLYFHINIARKDYTLCCCEHFQDYIGQPAYCQITPCTLYKCQLHIVCLVQVNETLCGSGEIFCWW